MKWLLLLLVFLAGCSGPVEYSFHLTQCEDPPWGAPEDAGAISAHYEVTVTDLRLVEDGNVYLAVCGAPSGTHVVITIDGDPARLTNWTVGAP